MWFSVFVCIILATHATSTFKSWTPAWQLFQKEGPPATRRWGTSRPCGARGEGESESPEESSATRRTWRISRSCASRAEGNSESGGNPIDEKETEDQQNLCIWRRGRVTARWVPQWPKGDEGPTEPVHLEDRERVTAWWVPRWPEGDGGSADPLHQKERGRRVHRKPRWPEGDGGPADVDHGNSERFPALHLTQAILGVENLEFWRGPHTLTHREAHLYPIR